MGKTFAEKLLSIKANRDVVAGDIVVVTPDYCISHENSSSIISTFKKITDKVWDNKRIVMTLDHTVPASSETYALSHKIIREFAAEQGIINFFDLNKHGGICHQVMMEKGFDAPGRLILGSDSHTCTAGALGCFATGIGRSEMASIWASGEIWLQVPETIKVVVNGKFNKGVYSKDLILYLEGMISASGANYKCIEFSGEGIESLSVGERMTLCNMGIEMDAKAAYCVPDQKVFDHMAKLGITDYTPVYPDEDAKYCQEIIIDLKDLVPCVAKPSRVDNYAPIDEVKGTRIDQCFIGACTNGRIDDLRVAEKILRGKQVAVRTVINPASVETVEQMIDEGIYKSLIASGCTINAPGCGPCIGIIGGILAEGERCISTSNRNFVGRMGSKKAEIYLASPAMVAASALTGVISDPREVCE